MTERAGDARFEYRVWAPPGAVIDAIRSRGRHTGRSRVRDCYVLGHDPDLNAKIREDRLEVKRLVERRSGFERWTPAWSARAPFEPSAVARLYDEFGLPAEEDVTGEPLSVDELVAALRDAGHLHAAWVRKRREFFEIDEVSTEVTEIEIDLLAGTMTTAAIEGTDLDALMQLGARLGMTDLDNVPVDRAVLAAVRRSERAD